jgi:hypothetical protein
LESRCYNKSHPGPKPSTSPRYDDRKLFLICFKSPLDFPKWCLYLVATTSRILALSLVLLQDMMIESFSLFVLNPHLTFLSGACVSFISQPSVLLSSCLSLSYIIVGLHVPSYNHPTLIVLLYWLRPSITP